MTLPGMPVFQTVFVGPVDHMGKMEGKRTCSAQTQDCSGVSVFNTPHTSDLVPI